MSKCLVIWRGGGYAHVRNRGCQGSDGTVLNTDTILERGLRQLIEHGPMAVAVADPAGELIYVNESAARLLGGELGRDLPPSVLEGGRDIFYEEEFVLSLADGEPRILRCDACPVCDGAGATVASVVVMRDVTERKRLDDEHAYSTRLLESMDDAVLATDDRLVLTAWNRGAERMFGWSSEEALGHPVYEILPQDYPDEQQADELRQLLDTGRWRGERAWSAKDGTLVHADGLTAVVRGETGAVVGYVCLMRDIADRRRAEQAAQEAQRRSEVILESITDAFCALDHEWRITYANEQVVRFAGHLVRRELTREGLVGQVLWTLLPGTVGTALETRCRQAMRDQQRVVFEYQFPGGDSWFEVHAYPSRRALSIYLHDITARKRAEHERELRVRQQQAVASLGLRAAADDDAAALAQMAVEVVASMLNVELAGVLELLSRGEMVKAGVGFTEQVLTPRASDDGSLVSYTLECGEPVISNDLSADSRFGPSSLFSEHGAISGAAAVVQGRGKQFGVLAALSTNRRRFSRADATFLQGVANVVAVALERADTDERMREVREAERRRMARALHDEALQDLSFAMEKAAHLSHDPPGRGVADEITPALVRVSEHVRGAIYDLRIGQEQHRPFPELLAELIAMHAAVASYDIELESGPGTPQHSLGVTGIEIVRILGEALTNARRHATPTHVTIRTGGSESRLWCEVADRQGETCSQQRAPGHGVGIAGMNERAALIGAGVTIDSSPGAGTTVRLEVPLSQPGGAGSLPVRVLLVEDHAAVREALATFFERHAGFRVVGQAESLAQAREMLEEVDVAVLDLGLPDGYGADMIDDLRGASPRAQALALTASLDTAEIARAVECGAAAVLPKTTPLDEIVQAVRRLHVGDTLLPLDEVVELLRRGRRDRDRRRIDLTALERLTAREREVLQLLAEGHTARHIAARLHVAPRTLRNHVASILAKLGVHSQLQAVILALRYDAVRLC